MISNATKRYTSIQYLITCLLCLAVKFAPFLQNVQSSFVKTSKYRIKMKTTEYVKTLDKQLTNGKTVP